MTQYLNPQFSVACSSGAIDSDEAQARWDATFGKRGAASVGHPVVTPSDSPAPRGGVGAEGCAPSASLSDCARLRANADVEAFDPSRCIHADTNDSECDDCALECEWSRNDDDPIWLEGEGEHR